MATGTLAIVAVIGGKSINQTITKTFDHPNPYVDIPLPAGKAVTSWVKGAGDDAATCNLPADHGYVDGKMDVFWTGGRRYDVDGTIVTNALTLDGGTGDAFPASASADVVVCTPIQINTAIDGDQVAMMIVNCTQRASLYFEDADGDSIAHLDISAANEPYTWHDTSNLTNPLTGDPIVVCFASNGSTTAAVLDISTGEDSTP